MVRSWCKQWCKRSGHLVVRPGCPHGFSLRLFAVQWQGRQGVEGAGHGERILSAYTTTAGERIWSITDQQWGSSNGEYGHENCSIFFLTAREGVLKISEVTPA
jgi:hypothetical protein